MFRNSVRQTWRDKEWWKFAVGLLVGLLVGQSLVVVLLDVPLLSAESLVRPTEYLPMLAHDLLLMSSVNLVLLPLSLLFFAGGVSRDRNKPPA